MKKRSDLRDAILYGAEHAERDQWLSFLNLVSSALSYGMVMGSARTGLGTDNPAGPSIPGDSLYYQGLHAYSAFDWEFQRSLLTPGATSSLPRSMAVLAGRFPQSFVGELEDEATNEVARAHRVAAALAPGLKPFAFRRLDSASVLGVRERVASAFSARARSALWQGTIAKLDAIETLACSPSAADLPTKLATMASAFVPLSTALVASFDAANPTQSFTRFAVYLPALHTLRADDLDDPAGWYLERGVSPFALPAPVQISAACITGLSYLRSSPPGRPCGLGVEISRDFDEPHTVTMTAGFGELLAEASADLLGLDCDDPQSALCLSLRVSLPEEGGDDGTTRLAKEAFNRAMAGFEIEARVHKLVLHLRRDDPRKLASVEQLLRPRFSQHESKISFRVQRHTESRTEMLSMRALGFTCLESTERPGYDCSRDFWTWQRLMEFLGGGNLLGSAGLLSVGREKLLGQVIARATQVVLDHSIESIQGSVDRELARVVGYYLDRYATARDAVASRLHTGLFST